MVNTTGDMVQALQKRRRQLVRLFLESALITLASLAVVGTQLFYPFHVVIGVTLYILSYIPFVYRIYLSRDTWRRYHSYGLAKDFIKKEHRRIILATLLLLVSAVFLWVRPLDYRPFADMTDVEIESRVQDDLYLSVTAMDYLESTGNDLLEVLSTEKTDVNATEDIALAFDDFIQAVVYSESLTDEHRYYAGIPYRLWNTRLTSFLISYSLYIKKYEIIHRMMMVVDGSEHKKKALNQTVPSVGRGNIYTEMVSRFYEPKTRVRLTGGYLYQSTMIGDDDMDNYSFVLLRDKAYESYEYLSSNFGETLLQAPDALSDSIEQNLFDAWFPIQKVVATAMGRAIISTRGKEGLIKEENILLMEKKMLPGDIMLQRRNWHVSNVGIPGFWTHSALYTGDLETMDEYFASEFPYDGYDSLSELMASVTPEVYEKFKDKTSNGESVKVVEAIEPGVVLQTLVKSANADFVVVLRPNLNKSDILQALLKAFANMGKPYDFNFDFDTRDALVCSELVYDAYFERLPEKNGLHFETSVVNGRKIVSPLDMANKYVNEKNMPDPELKFVYFLKSDEETGEVSIASEVDFVESVKWSKFSFMQSDQ